MSVSPLGPPAEPQPSSLGASTAAPPQSFELILQLAGLRTRAQGREPEHDNTQTTAPKAALAPAPPTPPAPEPHRIDALPFDELHFFQQVALTKEPEPVAMTRGVEPATLIADPGGPIRAPLNSASPMETLAMASRREFRPPSANAHPALPAQRQTQAAPPGVKHAPIFQARPQTRADSSADASLPVRAHHEPKTTTPAAPGSSAVFVAFHAADGAFNVHARAGRMSPTDRIRLRHAVGALMAAYGIFDARVSIDGEGSPSWPK